MNNKNRISRIFITVISVIIVICMFTGCSNESNSEQIKENSSSIETVQDYSIETRYGKMYFPEKWQTYIDVQINENDPYTVQFFATLDNEVKARLFNIVFGGSEGVYVGKLIDSEGAIIDVHIVMNELSGDEDYTEEQSNLIIAIQEDVNHIISKMPIIKEEHKKENDVESSLETPFISLQYPEKWKDVIRVNHIQGDEYTVEFFGKIGDYEEIHLFDISFGEETGNSIGSIKCKDGSIKNINVITYDIDFSDEWVEDRKNEIYSMAEDINIILQNIMENDSFVK